MKAKISCWLVFQKFKTHIHISVYRTVPVMDDGTSGSPAD